MSDVPKQDNYDNNILNNLNTSNLNTSFDSQQSANQTSSQSQRLVFPGVNKGAATPAAAPMTSPDPNALPPFRSIATTLASTDIDENGNYTRNKHLTGPHGRNAFSGLAPPNQTVYREVTSHTRMERSSSFDRTSLDDTAANPRLGLSASTTVGRGYPGLVDGGNDPHHDVTHTTNTLGGLYPKLILDHPTVGPALSIAGSFTVHNTHIAYPDEVPPPTSQPPVPIVSLDHPEDVPLDSYHNDCVPQQGRYPHSSTSQHGATSAALSDHGIVPPTTTATIQSLSLQHPPAALSSSPLDIPLDDVHGQSINTSSSTTIPAVTSPTSTFIAMTQPITVQTTDTAALQIIQPGARIPRFLSTLPSQPSTQNLSGQNANSSRREIYVSGKDLAVVEILEGLHCLDTQQPKPIPTFTRCLLTNDVPNPDPSSRVTNELIINNGLTVRKARHNDADPELTQVAEKFLNCLRLRREFLWTPSIYDRTSFDLSPQTLITSTFHTTYNPPMDGKTIDRNHLDIGTHDVKKTEGTLDRALGDDLAQNPTNYVYGFVDGVVQVYHKSVVSELETVPGSGIIDPKYTVRPFEEILKNDYQGYTPQIKFLSQNSATLREKQFVFHQGQLIHSSYLLGADYSTPETPFASESAHDKSQNVHSFVSGLSTPSHITPSSSSVQPTSSSSSSLPSTDNITPVPRWYDFCDSLAYILSLAADGPCKSWSHSRLFLLESQTPIHSQLNNDLELAQSKVIPHRDFYNVRKIDNHIHHSACMNQKHLLRFIKKKLKEEEKKAPEDRTIVISRDGKDLTLPQVFESLNLRSYDLSIDTLDMHAHQTFHRFDKFNLKYNPVGESRLREIFLKYNNKIKGEYLAEVTKEVFEDLETNRYQLCEYRMSIYGKDRNEWNALADWIHDNNLVSPNVRWMIQIPRLYGVYRRSNSIANLQEMISNIFLPLFHVTLYPESNPRLHQFLSLVIGIDTVDDESVRTKFFDRNEPPPDLYTHGEDPHYCSFIYYLYANLHALNTLRQLVGFNTWHLRPHAGEAGDIEHVAASFLCAKGINHGLTLFRCPPIQYLYYLSQTGISMSPLSNNLLFLEYQKNPFPKFFARGLNVTLSTDDPLMIHVTKEPLVEEYSVASQVWKLSHIDLCEIARSSVLQSGFEHKYKACWLGNGYWKRTVDGNDIRSTNVPDIRIQFRWELLCKEHLTLHNAASKQDVIDPSLIDPIW